MSEKVFFIMYETKIINKVIGSTGIFKYFNDTLLTTFEENERLKTTTQKINMYNLKIK